MTQQSPSQRPRRFAREVLPGENAPQPVRDASLEGADAVLLRALPKTTIVLGLLTRAEGAGIDELIAVTGWLPHTTRAALTGLRKKGHTIIREKVDGVTRYMIKPEAGE
jgi:hypothetical protein